MTAQCISYLIRAVLVYNPSRPINGIDNCLLTVFPGRQSLSHSHGRVTLMAKKLSLVLLL